MTATTKFDLRRDAIVRAASEILNHKGVRGMTLQLVAAELNLAPRGVSYYFRRKEDLAAACYNLSLERMNGHISAGLREKTASDAIRTFVRSFIEDQRQICVGEVEPHAWFYEMRTIQDPGSSEAFTNFFRNIRRVFKMSGAPVLDRDERNARAHLLLSQMLWAGIWLPRYNPDDYGRMGERVADILLQGMAAPDADWSPPTLLANAEPESEPAFLRAATELINNEGYLGASVSRISARLNVTKGSFYHHHEGKDELVEECFERTWAILRQAQAEADTAASNGLMNLAAQAVATVSGQVSGVRPLLRASALIVAPEEMRPRLIAGFDRITARYASVIADGFGDGSVKALDVLVGAQMLSGAINAAAELHNWVAGVTPTTAERVYVKPLFLGLLSSGSADKS